MHYTGMAAMQDFAADPVRPLLFAASIAIAIMASLAALSIPSRCAPTRSG